MANSEVHSVRFPRPLLAEARRFIGPPSGYTLSQLVINGLRREIEELARRWPERTLPIPADPPEGSLTSTGGTAALAMLATPPEDPSNAGAA